MFVEPRGEDEVTIVLDMAVDGTSKLDQVLTKLAKLDAIETTLNQLCQRMIGMESEVRAHPRCKNLLSS